MSIEDRVAALEARLQAAEDHLEILNLLNCYGPLVDSGSGPEAADLWIEGGTYTFTKPDRSDGKLASPDGLIGMHASEGHMGLVNTGCAHLTATPRITVDGDRATALGYSLVVLREGDRWFLWRAAVNEWKLVRTAKGWKIEDRFNRPLDGAPDSHEVMRRVIGR